MSASPKTRASAQRGIAPKGKYTALSLAGVRKEPSIAIFPIIRQHLENQTHDLVGTGFFVAGNGIFLTARHVFETASADVEGGPYALAIIQFDPDGKTYSERPVRMTICSPTADIGIGIAQEMKHNVTGQLLDNPILRLTPRDPDVGERIATYAYPDTVTEPADNKTAFHFNPHFYDGSVVEHFPERRDSALLTWPCFQTDMHIHGGASGGPVFDASGAVFGVNTASMEPHTDTSYVSKVSDALDLGIAGCKLGLEGEEQIFSLRQLNQLGFAKIKY